MLPHIFLLALSLGNVLAYPWMDPNYKGPIPRSGMERAGEFPVPSTRQTGLTLAYDTVHAAAEEKRLLGLGSTVSGVLTGAGGILSGLVGAIAQNVNPNDKRPDAAHPFQAPGPTDQRGPCPGLNTLANHGCKPDAAHC